MKKKSVVFALIIAAFASVTSGCNVEYEYEHPYRNRYETDYHNRNRNGDNNRDHQDRDNRDHDSRGY
ncbi:MAG: hypothetical protein M3N14_08685 [Bacteroidota bacterium]|nr:hypothetical protein [Bacteroidota bacterium]